MMLENQSVAILVESSSAYGRGLLQGITRFQQEARLWSVSYQTPDSGQDLEAWIGQWHGDGILARVPNASVAECLLSLGCPLVDLRGGTLPYGIPTFGVDNRAIAKAAYDHFRERGLNHFAFVGQSSGHYCYDDQRREAFVSIVRQYGYSCLEYQQDLIVEAEHLEVQRRCLVDWLQSLPQPVGVFCCHDDLGHQVLRSCSSVDLSVPDEIAVLGVDNDPYMCGLSLPHLSSIEIDSERIGYEAAKLLHEMMTNKLPFDTPVAFLPAEVVVRQSTDVFACDDPHIAAALRFIHENACNGIAIDQIQEHVGISRAALYKGFKRMMGRTIKQEVLRIQIRQAEIMLSHTIKPIYEVAEQTGFAEAKYFATVFQKYTGMTPRQYRQSAMTTNASSTAGNSPHLPVLDGK